MIMAPPSSSAFPILSGETLAIYERLASDKHTPEEQRIVACLANSLCQSPTGKAALEKFSHNGEIVFATHKHDEPREKASVGGYYSYPSEETGNRHQITCFSGRENIFGKVTWIVDDQELLRVFTHELGHFDDFITRGKKEFDNSSKALLEGYADRFVFVTAQELNGETKEALLDSSDLNHRFVHFTATDPQTAGKSETDKISLFTDHILPIYAVDFNQQSSYGHSYSSHTVWDAHKKQEASMALPRNLAELTQHPDAQPLVQATQKIDAFARDNITRTNSDIEKSGLWLRPLLLLCRKILLKNLDKTIAEQSFNTASLETGQKELPIPCNFIPVEHNGEQFFFPVRRRSQPGATLLQIQQQIYKDYGFDPLAKPDDPDVTGEYNPEPHALLRIVHAMEELKACYYNPKRAGECLKAIIQEAQDRPDAVAKYPALQNRINGLFGKKTPVLTPSIG